MTNDAGKLERDPVDVLEHWAGQHGHLISYVKIGKSPCTVEVRRHNAGESFRSTGATFDDATQNAASAALRGWTNEIVEPRLGEEESIRLVKNFARQAGWSFSQVTYTQDGAAYTCTYRIGNRTDGHIVEGAGIGASERVARQAAVRVLAGKLDEMKTQAATQDIAAPQMPRPAALVAN